VKYVTILLLVQILQEGPYKGHSNHIYPHIFLCCMGQMGIRYFHFVRIITLPNPKNEIPPPPIDVSYQPFLIKNIAVLHFVVHNFPYNRLQANLYTRR
jgi:hypothetical protein